MGDLYVLLDKGNDLLKELDEKDYSSYLKNGMAWTVIAVAGMLFKQYDVAFAGFAIGASIAFSAFVVKYRHELKIVELFSQVIKVKDQLKTQAMPTPPLNLNFQDMPKSPKPYVDTPKTPKAPPIDWMGKLKEKDTIIEQLQTKIASFENHGEVKTT